MDEDEFQKIMADIWEGLHKLQRSAMPATPNVSLNKIISKENAIRELVFYVSKDNLSDGYVESVRDLVVHELDVIIGKPHLEKIKDHHHFDFCAEEVKKIPFDQQIIDNFLQESDFDLEKLGDSLITTEERCILEIKVNISYFVQTCVEELTHSAAVEEHRWLENPLFNENFEEFEQNSEAQSKNKVILQGNYVLFNENPLVQFEESMDQEVEITDFDFFFNEWILKEVENAKEFHLNMEFERVAEQDLKNQGKMIKPQEEIVQEQEKTKIYHEVQLRWYENLLYDKVLENSDLFNVKINCEEFLQGKYWTCEENPLFWDGPDQLKVEKNVCHDENSAVESNSRMKKSPFLAVGARKIPFLTVRARKIQFLALI